jgi:S-formylglutathione hydrolase FrmB
LPPRIVSLATVRPRSLLPLLLCLAGLLLGATAASAAPLAGTIGYSAYSSQALAGASHYAVYLPPGYAKSGLRYPVVYFLHGLPGDSFAYRTMDWVARGLEQSGHKAIVIGAQGSRNSETDSEWLDRGPRHNWETATAKELVSVVDQRYRTIANRGGRALVGVSAGGYGAASIGFHHPETFAAIQSWSGYFQPTNPAGTRVLDLGSRTANERANIHALVPNMRRALGRYYGKTYFSFYVGTGDRRFRSDNERLSRELSAAKVPNVTFGLYPGRHGLWRVHAPGWLALALSAISGPE